MYPRGLFFKQERKIWRRKREKWCIYESKPTTTIATLDKLFSHDVRGFSYTSSAFNPTRWKAPFYWMRPHFFFFFSHLWPLKVLLSKTKKEEEKQEENRKSIYIIGILYLAFVYNFLHFYSNLPLPLLV